MSNPTVELTLPVMQDMELAATKTAEVIAKRMNLNRDKTDEISMALIEACINAFEHSKSKDNIFIQYIIDPEKLIVKVGDKGIGFDDEVVAIPKIEEKLNSATSALEYAVMHVHDIHVVIKDMVTIKQNRIRSMGEAKRYYDAV